MGVKRGFIGTGAGMEHDGGMNQLTIAFIGNTEHGHLTYRRVAAEYMFDFGGMNVLATRNNELFDAANQCEVAPALPSRQITGVNPTIAQALCGCGSVVPIGEHAAGGGAQHFANGPIRHFVPSSIDNTQMTV